MTTVGPPPPPPSAAAVFGDRLDLAERFVEILATAGLERGLLGPREAGRLWDRHLLNCAVIGELIAPGSRVVDVGSGAGLPGLVLSIVRPDLTVDLVEPLLRRSAFLDEVVAELGLHARVARGRAESASIRHQVGGADVVVSRALAPLARLAAWCLPLARPGGSVMAIKGASVHEEIERDRTAVQRSGGRDVEVLEVGAGVVSPPTMVARFRRAH